MGAEVISVINNIGVEFMWQANPQIWPRTAPVLFPIVGKLCNNQYHINEQTYQLGQHGFARDLMFNVISHNNDKAVFELTHTNETLKIYPFKFTFQITYTLNQNNLNCQYVVCNLSPTPMPFNIGAHPGFALPDENLSNYQVLFECDEKPERHLLSNGLFNGTTQVIPIENKTLNLHVNLFDDDAIVMKNIASSWVNLKHTKSPWQIAILFKGFNSLGIWTKQQCQQFVCIEPWIGYADNVEGNGSFFNKPDIIVLQESQTFAVDYTITCNS